MIKLILFACIFFCSQAFTANIFQLSPHGTIIDLTNIEPNHQPWNASSIYLAGDIVTHNNSLFIAAFWVKGIEPIENQTYWDGWIWLQNTVIEKWQANKIYQGGSLIKHGTDYYFARYWNENNQPKAHSSWQRINDLFYLSPDLPPEHPDDYKTLDGVDQNDNGIRDDYERYVYEKFDSPQLITFSLSSASTLQLVIDIEQDRIPNLDAEISKQIILDFINISFCTEKIQNKFSSYRNPKLMYFNTIDRAYANRKGQNKAHDLIPWDDDFHLHTDMSCAILEGIMKGKNGKGSSKWRGIKS
ncbi:chitodextrinase [Pseudoalteromonas ulvae]|nr:chitodextrinase [Pseudoalteromonas ulvae]